MQQAQAAIILFAHGSRDPLWRVPLEAVAAHIAAQQPGRPVLCAYLELCTPSLPDAAQQLAAQGGTRPPPPPPFLFFPRWQTAIGEDPRMTALMAEIACEAPQS